MFDNNGNITRLNNINENLQSNNIGNIAQSNNMPFSFNSMTTFNNTTGDHVQQSSSGLWPSSVLLQEWADLQQYLQECVEDQSE